MYVYLDGILVVSQSEEQSFTQLHALFDRFGTSGLNISASKCELGKLSVTFLVQIIWPSGTVPLTGKVTAIRDQAETNSFRQA